MARRPHRRSRIGVLPRLWRAIVAGGRWAVRHPQPAVLGVLLLAATWGLWRYAQHADAFRIAHVQVPSHSSLRIPDSVVGTNIWALDIEALARTLNAQQPSLKDVRVVRRLPNALVIEPIPRVPVAQVRMSASSRGALWHPLDRDGYILPEAREAPADGLVRFTGFMRPGSALQVGRSNTDERLTLALRVLEALQRSPALLGRRLSEVDVADPQQIRFTLHDGTEVRCGSEAQLREHLERLRTALRASAKGSVDIQYIDVRFPETVVAPRT